VAELVEKSVDARATTVSIIRGCSEGNNYLEIRDDGQGIPRDAEGRPDFRYVAIHICDSVKRRLKVEGVSGLLGEFGIGLLSFWTLGEELMLTSTGADDRAWQMVMRKGDPGYTVKARRTLFAEPGTQLRINRLLEGIRSLSGEKIQWYLAAELRDRIRHSGVRITVIDKIARKQCAVEPRQYEGRLLHHLPAVRATTGDVYVELYMNEPKETNRVALFRHGTRVVEDIPWLTNSRSHRGPHVIFKGTSMHPSSI
jgi:DNA gyrase/topoisomerase IV subunit B